MKEVQEVINIDNLENIKQNLNIKSFSETINELLLKIINKKGETTFNLIKVEKSPTYKKKLELKALIPVYIRPINDKTTDDFGILHCNSRNPKVISILEDFLSSVGLPGKINYSGYIYEGLEIGFSQFLRRYVPKPEEKLIDYLNQQIKETARCAE